MPGDRLESIASGPAVADPVPLDHALALIADAGLDRLDFMPAQLRRITDGTADLPLRAGDPVTARVTSHLLASNTICRAAARDVLSAALPGMEEVQLPDLAGEATDCAAHLAELMSGGSKGAGLWAVTGGETTVQLGASPGKGGRAQEMGIAYAAAMHDAGTGTGWAGLIGGTDGRDGPTDAAGAILGSDDPFDAAAAARALAAHDSYSYLDAHGQLLKVPPTGTNLGDIGIFIAAGSGQQGD